MPRHRQILVLLAILCAFVWIYFLVHAVRMEERGTTRQEIMLDNTGQPVQTYSHVWELGKGYRTPTQEEKDFEGRR